MTHDAHDDDRRTTDSNDDAARENNRRFDATDALAGERVYLGFSDATQATILRWKGILREVYNNG